MWPTCPKQELKKHYLNFDLLFGPFRRSKFLKKPLVWVQIYNFGSKMTKLAETKLVFFLEKQYNFERPLGSFHYIKFLKNL